ncbi:hypothetical protein ACWIUD_06025 [Helicobacter sp. 23-1044]
MSVAIHFIFCGWLLHCVRSILDCFVVASPLPRNDKVICRI